MKVPLLDLKAQYAGLKHEIEPAVLDVFESQYFILGPRVKACEEEVAAYCHSPYAVGVSSGTDALLIALMCEEIGPGDEVITTPYTFFATGGCIARVGATPVFVDIDPATYNINPSLIEKKITRRTRAIMPVHLYGQTADMDPLLQLAEKHHLVVIEDAAQAIGAESNGRRAGSMGAYGCFSFFPSKNLGAAGDGGMVVTQDSARYEKLLKLRNHGSAPKYYHALIGGNFRLDALQAAVVSIKLRHLDAWSEARQHNAARYDELFSRVLPTGTDAWLSGRGVVLPEVTQSRHIFNQYIVRVPRRDALRDYLQEKDVGHEVYYPVPLHLQECFAYLGYPAGALPEAESAAQSTLALPVYPELTDEQAAYVVSCIADYINH